MPTIGQVYGLDRVEAEVLARAQIGLRNATEFCLGRAKHHAPVRKLFKGDRRPKTEFSKSFKTIRTKARFQQFLASKGKARRFDIGPQLTGELPDAIRAEQSGGIRRGGRFLGRAGTVRGKANSLFPIFRGKDRFGSFKITGDFRKLTTLTAPEARYNDPRLPAAPQALKQRPGRPATLIAGRQEKRGRARAITQSNLHNRLTGRGRLEVREAAAGRLRSGRDRHGRAFALSANFNGRVGGRLRGEIFMSPPTVQGKEMWMYVESPTPYAVHQEFGTRHHAPQPFLRPALYESRTVLISEVRRAVQTRAGHRPSSVTGQSLFTQPQNFVDTPNPLGGVLQDANERGRDVLSVAEAQEASPGSGLI